jgi:uncharacterized membrane protein
MKEKPFWFPDTKGFLAISIVFLIALVVVVLLIRPPTFEEKIYNTFSLILGILLSNFKDVFSFEFNSSKGSDDKNKTIDKLISAVPVIPTTTTTVSTSADETKTTVKPTAEINPSASWKTTK